MLFTTQLKLIETSFVYCDLTLSSSHDFADIIIFRFRLKFRKRTNLSFSEKPDLLVKKASCMAQIVVKD